MSELRPPVAVEADTGAQLLPQCRERTARLNSYDAHLACDADLRTKHEAYRARAARIKIIYPVPSTGQEEDDR